MADRCLFQSHIGIKGVVEGADGAALAGANIHIKNLTNNVDIEHDIGTGMYNQFKVGLSVDLDPDQIHITRGDIYRCIFLEF